MASAGGSHLPAFEEIIKRGSITEPRKGRPVPKNCNPIAELSLNAAVESANKSRSKNKKSGVSTLIFYKPDFRWT